VTFMIYLLNLRVLGMVRIHLNDRSEVSGALLIATTQYVLVCLGYTRKAHMGVLGDRLEYSDSVISTVYGG